MKNLISLAIAILMMLLFLILPAAGYTASVMPLSDSQLDQVQAGVPGLFATAENFLNQLFVLATQDQNLISSTTTSTINASNSVVVTQSNIAFALNFSGEINQSNNAVITNNPTQ
jgi:hypothetical protein